MWIMVRGNRVVKNSRAAGKQGLKFKPPHPFDDSRIPFNYGHLCPKDIANAK